MYTASYRRGRLPSIEIETDDVGEQAPRATEEQLRGSAPARDETISLVPCRLRREGLAPLNLLPADPRRSLFITHLSLRLLTGRVIMLDLLPGRHFC